MTYWLYSLDFYSFIIILEVYFFIDNLLSYSPFMLCLKN